MISTTTTKLVSKPKHLFEDLERIVVKYNPCVDDDGDVQVDWLNLPDSLICLVTDKLVHFKDFIRFGAVCKPWRSVYLERRHHFRRLKPQLPLLMLPTQRDEARDYETRSLFSLTDNAISNFQPPVHYVLLCPGSCYGWLVTVSREPDFEVTLFNPFISDPNKNTIKLPPLTEFEIAPGEDSYTRDYQFLNKVVLSADPATTADYVVMAKYACANRLAFFKPGTKTWTSLPSTRSTDITYYQGKFHSVDCSGVVDAWDIHHHPPTKQTVSLHVNSARGPLMRYIVESSGHLLQVLRLRRYDNDNDISRSNYFTAGFHVFQLDPKSFKWIRIHHLHGHSLFLGDNASLSIPVSDFPECKPNSIYYTDDFYYGYRDKEQYRIGPHDMGIFSVEDGTFEKYYPTESNMILPAPIWIQPTLCG